MLLRLLLLWTSEREKRLFHDDDTPLRSIFVFREKKKKKKKVRVRRAEERDLPQLRTLHEQLFPVRYDEDFFSSLVSPMLTLVVVEEEESDEGSRVLGVASGLVAEKKRKGASLNVAYLATFGLAHHARGQGRGAELLAAFFSLVSSVHHECAAVALHVEERNREARKFYSKHHFVEVSRKAGHYVIEGRPRDAVKMVASGGFFFFLFVLFFVFCFSDLFALGCAFCCWQVVFGSSRPWVVGMVVWCSLWMERW